MKKVCLLLAFALFLCGCTGAPTLTEPTVAPSISPVFTTSADPAASTDEPFNQEWIDCEVITPEEGVLILHGNRTLRDRIIKGDVYITANAKVLFEHVSVIGKVYVHGKLTLTGHIFSKGIYAYKEERFSGMCSAYDGIHGEIILNQSQVSGRTYVAVDALDYAFETWGKVEPEEPPPAEVRLEDICVANRDPAKAHILSGKQTLAAKVIEGDVYITSDADVTFSNTTIFGNVYVAGKLHISDLGPDLNLNFKTEVQGNIYAYDFGVTCEAFDGTHGQVTGGPVLCRGYVVANDALDYAFETWGKQQKT